MDKEIVFTGREGLAVYQSITFVNMLHETFEKVNEPENIKILKEYYDKLTDEEKFESVAKSFAFLSLLELALNYLKIKGLDVENYSYSFVGDLDRIGEVKFIQHEE